MILDNDLYTINMLLINMMLWELAVHTVTMFCIRQPNA